MWSVTRIGAIKNAVVGIFVCILLYLGVFSNLRCREWKDTKSIKKELRELIKQRPDYIPEEYEELMENEKIKN